jgi:hypothetical protein
VSLTAAQSVKPRRWSDSPSPTAREPISPPTLCGCFDLVNRDKHRDLLIASYAMSAFTVGEHDLYTVVSTTVHDVPMQVGAVVAEANLKLAQVIRGERWEQVACEVEYGEIPDARPVNLMSVMRGIVNPLAHCSMNSRLPDAEPGRRPRRRAGHGDQRPDSGRIDGVDIS